ncbi:MAG: FGGY family carbohydrate kinase [Lachnospiraceae bacterium]
MLYLSIDFGTSAVKLSIVDRNGDVKGWAKHDYSYIILPGEKSEIDARELFRAMYKAADQLDSSLRKQVGCLCYDTFSPSPVFMDKNGELVYPNIITHMDRRSRAQVDYIDQVVGRDAYMNISGIYPFAGGCSAMTFIWFMQNEPEVYKNTYRIGHLTTYVHKKLTGEWMVDLVNASMMGLYETTTQKGWSKELMKVFGLKEDWFGEIYNPGTVHGTLLPKMAQMLGVPAGIPVTIGTNDVAAAQMGAQNQRAGKIMNTAGSSEMISILTDKPVVNPHYYLRNAALPGLWQIYSTTAGGFAVDWFYEQFCRDIKKEDFYRDYIVHAIEIFINDHEVDFTPYLTGDRQSLEKKTASWTGLTLAATREQMLAALLRSIQGVLLTTINEAREVLKLDKTIKISGGMVTPTYLKLKHLGIPGYEFEVVDDCPIIGNVELAKYYAE